MSKSYRKTLGFSNATTAKNFLTAKDITIINWPLIEQYNRRLTDIFSRIQSTIPIPQRDIEPIVQSAYAILKANDILPTLSNHGRSPESVYYSWLQGYLTVIVFQPFIEKKLSCTLIQNGADDLTNPATFSRKSDPDLVDHNEKIYVEIQGGFKGSKVDIKKSKVKTSDTYQYYIACFDCFDGQYVIMNTKDIPENQWYPNQLWEGALCYTVPKNQMREWKEPFCEYSGLPAVDAYK